MRNLAAIVLLALCLVGCEAPIARGEQLPLPIDQSTTGFGGGGVLMHVVIDVVPDPRTSTPVIATEAGPMKWPRGFTAWRIGSEVEVLDPNGKRVLITGHRYLFRCSTYMPVWVISMVEPCPDCPLGFQLE
jgi:hypothetical protein